MCSSCHGTFTGREMWNGGPGRRVISWMSAYRASSASCPLVQGRSCSSLPPARAPCGRCSGSRASWCGPLRLELEDQYRRSEEPYAGPEEFSALAHAAWDEDALYLAVAVVKPELCFRPGGAPPLRLDNEPDDIHSDGLQVYVAGAEEGVEGNGCVGYLTV